MSDFFHPKRQAVSALEPYRFSTTWSTGEVLALDARFTLTVTAERIRSRPCLRARNGQRATGLGRVGLDGCYHGVTWLMEN